MKYFRVLFLLYAMQPVAFAKASKPCEHWHSFIKSICLRPYQTWTKGSNELYLSGYAWHNPHFYDKERLALYNERSYGGGLGKSFYDEDGDWHGLYAIAFLDSHKNIQPTAGYAFLKMLHLTEDARIGAGYSVLITQRPDIFHGVPFPGALPWMSLNYRRISLSATYIPGSRNAGNVLFVLAKWLF